MKATCVRWWAAGISLAIAAPAWAHFHLLIPDRPNALPGEEVGVSFFYGHPYEHEILEVAAPATIRGLSPTGESTPLGEAGRDSGEPKIRRYRYRIGRRGDHRLLVRTRPTLHEGTLRVDLVKTILHARSQRGWDEPAGERLEIVPLVRPYGFRPGWTFRALVLFEGRPLPGAKIEIERYNPRPPPGPLPPDESITRAAVTGPGGTFIATLDEEGWWVLTVERAAGEAEGPDGKRHPLLLRSTLCLRAEESRPAPSS